MQNLVVLMEPPQDYLKYNISSKGGNMCLNRFCIDEDAAYELSGVYYLDEPKAKLRRRKIVIGKGIFRFGTCRVV